MQTVVGMYNSVSEANKVKQALVDGGFSGGDITVIDQSESGYGSTSEAGYSGTSTTGSDDSVGGKIKHFFEGLTGHDEHTHQSYTQGVSRGGALVAVNTEDGDADRAAALLSQYGASDIEGGGGYGSSTGTYGSSTSNTGADYTGGTAGRNTITGEQVIPVVEEELVVGKRQVERGGVRVFSRVVSEPVSESVSLHDERVVVDRRPVNRAATEADFTEAGPIEVRAMGEEAVVGKTSRVVEEVLVGKTGNDRTETVEDSVRRTEVDVEPVTTGVGTSTAKTSNNY